MKKDRQKLGRKGEKLARKHLQTKGYRFLAKNFRTPHGEIDLIFEKNQTLVFVEVKTRTNNHFGLGEESLTPLKIKRMTQAAYAYQNLHPESPDQLRLDAFLIDLSYKNKPKLKHLKNITT